MCGPRGLIGGPDPPGKSQVIWASLDIMIRTPPPPPWKKLDPPPPLENVRTIGCLEKCSFLCNQTIGPPPLYKL